MNNDISAILSGWEYDANSINARWVKGTDDSTKVQLRVDLGVLQMEAKGRPDGEKPFGFPSLHDYYLDKESTLSNQDKELVLDIDACGELQQEAMQYYYRYLAFYALRHIEGVIADTQHNLNLFELISRCSDDDDVAWQFLQYFPYVRMMNARARCERVMETKQYDEAIRIAAGAIQALEAFYEENGEAGDGEESGEIEILEDLLYRIRRERPKTEEETLHELLTHAIHKENYERAAELRDAIQQLTTTGAGSVVAEADGAG